MNADSGHPLKTLRVDGGLSNSDICMQLQSNILGLEVSRPQMRESTALGAATAAGVHLGVGIWEGGFKAFAKRAHEAKEVLQIFTPQINDEGNDQGLICQRSLKRGGKRDIANENNNKRHRECREDIIMKMEG